MLGVLHGQTGHAQLITRRPKVRNQRVQAHGVTAAFGTAMRQSVGLSKASSGFRIASV